MIVIAIRNARFCALGTGPSSLQSCLLERIAAIEIATLHTGTEPLHSLLR
jgi:hypothetical protein